MARSLPLGATSFAGATLGAASVLTRSSLDLPGAAVIGWLGRLVLDASWSLIFVGAHRPVEALVVLGVLLPAIGAFAGAAAKADRLASRLVIPYAAGSSIAAWLNAESVRKS